MRHVFVCRGLLVVAVCCLVPMLADAADTGRQMQVATLCVDVTPPLGSPSYGGKPLETVETPLLAKGIVLDDGRQRVVLCAVDWYGLCASVHKLF